MKRQDLDNHVKHQLRRQAVLTSVKYLYENNKVIAQGIVFIPETTSNGSERSTSYQPQAVTSKAFDHTFGNRHEQTKKYALDDLLSNLRTLNVDETLYFEKGELQTVPTDRQALKH